MRLAPLTPLLLGLLAVTACAGPSTPASGPAAPPAAAPHALPFIEDDYARALAEARASHRLLFIDAWAPWCHTCLSMRAYTFRDPKVLAHAGELVWAAIDTEKAANEEWVTAHPMHAWPTLFVVDPSVEKIVLEWPNSATADELVKLLDAARAGAHHEGVLAQAEERQTEGNAAAAAGKVDEAIAAFRQALAVAPDGWPGRAATLEALLDRLHLKKEDGACAEAADRELPKVPRGGARAATLALMCVARLPAGEPRRPVLDRAVERVRRMAVDENEPMLPDDRSGLYEAMVDALEADGRDAEAKGVAKQWAAFLEGEAQRSPDPATRAVFDAHRVEAYLAVGTPDRAVPMLEQSARDFPRDYNPPARLARAYLAMKRYGEALAAIDRALGLVYGPRALRLYSTKADILEAKGDRPAAAAALREGIASVSAKKTSLPPRLAAAVDELSKRERALEVGR